MEIQGEARVLGDGLPGRAGGRGEVHELAVLQLQRSAGIQNRVVHPEFTGIDRPLAAVVLGLIDGPDAVRICRRCARALADRLALVQEGEVEVIGRGEAELRHTMNVHGALPHGAGQIVHQVDGDREPGNGLGGRLGGLRQDGIAGERVGGEGELDHLVARRGGLGRAEAGHGHHLHGLIREGHGGLHILDHFHRGSVADVDDPGILRLGRRRGGKAHIHGDQGLDLLALMIEADIGRRKNAALDRLIGVDQLLNLVQVQLGHDHLGILGKAPSGASTVISVPTSAR